MESLDHIRHAVDYIPFVGLITRDPVKTSPLFTRLAETAIMSVAAAGMSVYITVTEIKVQMNDLSTHVAEVQSSVQRVDDKVEKMRSDLYAPRH